MFLARLGAGLGQSTQLPVNAPLLDRHLSDPGAGEGVRGARWRPGGRHDDRAVPRRRGSPRSPATRTAGGGRSSLLGLVALPIALSAITIKEPRRGRHEMQSVLGEELAAGGRRAPDLAVGRVRAPAPDPELLLLPRRDGRARLRALHRAAVPQPLLRRRARARRVRARRRRARSSRSRRSSPSRSPGRRADDLFRRARPRRWPSSACSSRCSASASSIAIWMPNVWTVVPVLAVGHRVRAGGVRDPARGRVDDHPVPAARAWHRDDRHLRVPVRLVLRSGAHRPARATPTARAPRSTIIVLPSTLIGGALIALGARHIRDDMAMVVEELREEQDEMHRMQQADAVVPVDPGPQPRLLLRQGAGAVRRRLRRPRGRDARAARHQRRRQVDAAARHQRARRRRPRRRPASRSHGHLRRPRAAGAGRHRAAHRRRRDLPAAHRATRTCAWPGFLYARAEQARRIDRVARALPRARASAATRRRRISRAASSRCSRWR